LVHVQFSGMPLVASVDLSLRTQVVSLGECPVGQFVNGQLGLVENRVHYFTSLIESCFGLEMKN